MNLAISKEKNLKILSIHAHFDDFEFMGSGLFEKWKKKDSNLISKVVVCTNGEAGHHFRSRKETGELRRKEQMESAKIGKYELEFLKYPNGAYPREGCLAVDNNLLAALWKSIREFKPDYLFCPPVTSSTTAGIHIDHIAVADAVRKVAYMINVPHCFLPEFGETNEVSEFISLPVIVNFSDHYIKDANDLDFAVNIENEFEAKARMAWCHQSQIIEWLPWVTGASPDKIPKSFDEYKNSYLKNLELRNKKMKINKPGIFEFFTVTAWGKLPAFDDIIRDFPEIDKEAMSLQKLKEKLDMWTSS
jgi:LmbE family N-acetylglucosaminyl deacetylase